LVVVHSGGFPRKLLLRTEVMFVKQSKEERAKLLDLFLDELAAQSRGAGEFYLTDLNLRIRDTRDVQRAVRETLRRTRRLRKATKRRA
jgi:hypothetical protein